MTPIIEIFSCVWHLKKYSVHTWSNLLSYQMVPNYWESCLSSLWTDLMQLKTLCWLTLKWVRVYSFWWNYNLWTQVLVLYKWLAWHNIHLMGVGGFWFNILLRVEGGFLSPLFTSLLSLFLQRELPSWFEMYCLVCAG